jgi:hypothetical protein
MPYDVIKDKAMKENKGIEEGKLTLDLGVQRSLPR